MASELANLSISKKLKRKSVEPKLVTDGLSKEKRSKQDCGASAAPAACSFAMDVRLADIGKLLRDFPLASKILRMEMTFCNELMQLSYGDKVTHTYNPVDYAYKPHLQFYHKFCKDTAEVLLIGENPGPFGGAQTGVPFGDVKFVKEWLLIEEMVGVPKRQHSKRPVLGFESSRPEGSGTRLWTFLKEQFGTADKFFSRAFIYNYCPLIFMNKSGGNVTPSTMPASVKKQLMPACDKALGEVISSFPNCRLVVGIGRFAEQRIIEVSRKLGLSHETAYLLHPSPRNPEASKNWAVTASHSFKDFKLIVE